MLNREPKGDASVIPAEKIEVFVRRMSFEATRGRKVELDDSLPSEARSRVLCLLMEMDEANIVALNIGEFPASHKTAEWLLERKQSDAAADMATRLSAEESLDILIRLVDSRQNSEAARLLQNPNLRGQVPANIANEFIKQGQTRTVATCIEQFSPELSEDVALALIKIGQAGVSAYAHHKDLFTKSSQATFNALLQESPQLLRFIANNLSRFHTLNAESAAQLKHGGFGAEVDKHPECFV